MLKKRVLTSLWGIPLLAVAVWFEQPLPWFTILIALWGLLAAREFFKLLGAKGLSPFTYTGLSIILLIIISRNGELHSLVEPYFMSELVTPLLLAISLALPALLLVFRLKQKGKFISWAVTVIGIAYIGILLSHMVALRDVADGRNWAFFVLIVTMSCDTFAFFTGRAIGRRKLIPAISPKKTIEGAIGGLIAPMLVSLFFVLPTALAVPINWWQAIILGFLVSVFAQFGDLAESFFKRRMETKDSGESLPGHGGFLDRLDSLLFTGAITYYFVILFVI